MTLKSIYIYRPLRSVNFFNGIEQVWIQSFPSPRLVALPRLKNLVCPTILPIAGGRIIGFIPFPKVLVLCEMQSVSSRIWTRITVSFSYDDNLYTTGTSPPQKKNLSDRVAPVLDRSGAWSTHLLELLTD